MINQINDWESIKYILQKYTFVLQLVNSYNTNWDFLSIYSYILTKAHGFWNVVNKIGYNCKKMASALTQFSSIRIKLKETIKQQYFTQNVDYFEFGYSEMLSK